MNVEAMSVAELSTRAMPKSPTFTVPSFIRNTFCVCAHQTNHTAVHAPLHVQVHAHVHARVRVHERLDKSSRVHVHVHDSRESGKSVCSSKQSRDKENTERTGDAHLEVAVEHAFVVHVLRTKQSIRVQTRAQSLT